MAEPTKPKDEGKAKPAEAKEVANVPSIDDVNAIVAEAVTELKSELERQLSDGLEKLAAGLKETVEDVAAKALEETGAGGELEDGVNAAVRRELGHLHGLIENIATTVERSIGQRVSRNVAPRGAEHPLPSEIDAPPPTPGEGAETADSIA